MYHAGRGGSVKPDLTNAIVFDVRLRSSHKGAAAAESSGKGVDRVKREKQTTNGGWR